MTMNRRLPILLIFFLTGAAALIYQVTWVRQATLVFGVSVYAYSIVLAAFMGGMALGSLLLGHYAARLQQPLRLFGLLQLGIGLFGVIMPYALKAIMPLYAAMVQSEGSSLWLQLVRLLWASLLLTGPTLLMGATLPLLTKVVARQGAVGSAVGNLYAADTLGAALGCALTALVLLQWGGTTTTSLIAATLNLVAALLAWLIPIPAVDEPSAVPAPSRAPLPARTKRTPSPLPTRILWAYALSGLVALGYEVAWARILAIFTLNAVFSFAIMLSTFLTGLTVGGWIGAAWARRQRVTVRDFANLQCALGLAALLTLFLFARLPSLTLEDTFGVYSVTNVIRFEFLLGFITILLPTLLLGILFPIAISLYTQEEALYAAQAVGRLSAYNTVGGVIGSLLTGFGLIPLLGLQPTVVLLALVNLGLGAYLGWQEWRRADHQAWPSLAGAGLGLLLLLFLPAGYYLGFRAEPTEQMIFYAEGAETTVAVFEVPSENFKVSFVNGRIEVPTDAVSMRAFRLLGHLPAILRPHAERALMLSFGNGIATGSLNTHAIGRIDAVDLSAEQFAAAELYWIENYNVLTSPRLHTHVEDGRNFLLQAEGQYGIITTDATHPVNSSSWALFTTEFYQSVAARLTPDGVFMQWMPFHNLRESDYKAILRTFQAVFPHATLWYTGGSHTLLLATPERLTEADLLTHLQAAAELSTVQDDLGSLAAIRQDWVMDEAALRAYTGDGPLVTDDHAYFLPYATDTERILATMQGLVVAP